MGGKEPSALITGTLFLKGLTHLLGPVKSQGTLPVQKANLSPNLVTTIQESWEATTPVSQRSALAWRNENVLCWQDHSRSHVQAQCPQQEEPMECYTG